MACNSHFATSEFEVVTKPCDGVFGEGVLRRLAKVQDVVPDVCVLDNPQQHELRLVVHLHHLLVDETRLPAEHIESNVVEQSKLNNYALM